MEALYSKVFGYRPPYQVLIDSSMCRAALRHRLNFKEAIPIILGGAVRLSVTSCTMAELRVQADEARQASEEADQIVTGAPFVARRLDLLRCHHGTPQSSIACISNLIKERSEQHYCVLTDEQELKESCRKSPGIPLLYLERTFVMLEAPTALTVREADSREKAKLHVSEFEKQMIKKRLGLDTEEEKPVESKHKRKKSKGPNPLSVKKSRSTREEAKMEVTKRKRKRKTKSA